MMHPEDHYPYRSREELFETIRLQRIEIDNLHEEIRALRSSHIDLPSELPLGRLQYLDADDLDRWSEGLPV